MSDVEYIPASQRVYSNPEDVQRMSERNRGVHDEAKLLYIIDDTVNKKVHHLFKYTHEKAPPGTYSELYRTVKQAAANAIYLKGADDQINNKGGKLP